MAKSGITALSDTGCVRNWSAARWKPTLYEHWVRPARRDPALERVIQPLVEKTDPEAFCANERNMPIDSVDIPIRRYLRCTGVSSGALLIAMGEV